MDANQREGGGVAQREALPHDKVDDKAGDPCPVRVLGDQGAEDERQVEAAEAAELRRDHDDGQGGGGHQPKQRPTGPIHLSSTSYELSGPPTRASWPPARRAPPRRTR